MSEQSTLEKTPIAEVLMPVKGAFLDMVGGDVKEWYKELGYAHQIEQRSIDGKGDSRILKCAPKTIRSAFLNVAATGLTLSPPLALAYLIPQGNECLFRPSYRGLVKVCTDPGGVLAINAQVIYDGDRYEYQLGSNAFVKHWPLEMEPNPTEDQIKLLEQRAKDPMKHCVCVWVVATLHNGAEIVQVVPKWKVFKSKRVAKGTDRSDSPWKNWEEEQIRKTGIIWATKILPKSEKAALAVDIYHKNEFDISGKPEPKNALLERLSEGQEEADDLGRPFTQ